MGVEKATVVKAGAPRGFENMGDPEMGGGRLEVGDVGVSTSTSAASPVPTFVPLPARATTQTTSPRLHPRPISPSARPYGRHRFSAAPHHPGSLNVARLLVCFLSRSLHRPATRTGKGASTIRVSEDSVENDARLTSWRPSLSQVAGLPGWGRGVPGDRDGGTLSSPNHTYRTVLPID